MRWSGLYSVLIAAALPSCLIYDGKLIDEEASASGTGSATSSGGVSTGGSTGGIIMMSGGSDTGGMPPATGGDMTGGAGGAPGGNGGTETGGGGGDGDGDGTGGMVDEMAVLVDDLEQSATYFNDPFFGGWDRYGQEAGGSCSAANWDTGGVAGMIVEREDDASNHALAVNATDLDCWGIGVYLTLQQSGSTNSVDISSYSKLAFSVRGVGAETILRVRLEDESTHQATCDTFCNDHASAVGVPPLTSEWQDIEISLAAFMPEPMNTLDLTKAYAIHFTMDPGSEVADFLIDDIRFLE